MCFESSYKLICYIVMLTSMSSHKHMPTYSHLLKHIFDLKSHTYEVEEWLDS